MSRRSTPCSRDRDKTVTASNTVRAVRTALILLLVSLLLPLAGLAFGRRLEGMEWKETADFLCSASGVRMLLFFPLGFGVPIVQSIWLLRNRPERVMLLPASAALLLVFPLLLFRMNVLFVLFVTLALLSLLFLLTPRLPQGGRLGKFEPVEPELALKGFCLLEATGTALSLLPLLGNATGRGALLTGELLFLLFLALLAYGGLSLLRRRAR